MGLIRWFTKNWASTSEGTHRDLTPLVLPLSPADAVEWVRGIVVMLPRWAVVEAGGAQLHLIRRTRVLGFVDDIRLRFLPAGPGCLIQADSRSRVGVGDLGQNRRNILELWDAIRAAK